MGWEGLEIIESRKKRKKKTSSRIGVVVGMVGCGTMMQVGRGLHLHLHLHLHAVL